ncbi:MAG: type II secretion system secretin GspD [Methylococcales bacterium]|mgnify:CR=1 FL=1|jgi:general secretion pathway protein D|nr:type II secretion system secretin GspD [Methylococcales bacterium]MBT7411343.1 type II secretion system secretin GspD [Methylococcales bacterium]
MMLILLSNLGQANESTMILNLKNVDIKALIGTVSEMTGKNFIIDNRVKGKVTVISAKAMTKKEIYETFLSILQVHGFSAIPSGKTIKIIPSNKTKTQGLPYVSQFSDEHWDDQVTKVIHLEHVSAAQLIPVLRPLTPPTGHLAAHPSSNIIIHTDRTSNVKRLGKIIKSIDRPTQQDVEIIRLYHASATEVARILTSLFKTSNKNSPHKPSFISDERTNSILLTGNTSKRLKLRAIISHLDLPSKDTGNTKVIYLRYAKATDLAKILQDIAKTSKIANKTKSKKSFSSSIQADEKTNSLIITTAPDQLHSLEAIVQKLDIRRAQVLVEAIIAEVNDDQSKQLGIQWAFDGTPGSNGFVGGTNFGSSSGTSILQVASDNPTVGEGLSLGIGAITSGFKYGFLLTALSGDAGTNILATPSILTLDNTEAVINVGKNVPFVTGQFTSNNSGSSATNPFQTIKRENIGLTLKVKPQINEGNSIKLEIEQEVSSLDPTASGTVDIVTNKRFLKTTIMIEDGNTIVLGGLLDDNFQDVTQKIPLLGDLPLIGHFFRSQKTQHVKRNLMVFIHPTIIRDKLLSDHISHGKYHFIKKIQQNKNPKKTMLPDHLIPVLPDINELNYILPQ